MLLAKLTNVFHCFFSCILSLRPNTFINSDVNNVAEQPNHIKYILSCTRTELDER